MKKYSIILFIAILLFGCDTREVDLYDSPDFISFTTRQVDTVALSFFLLGNLSEYNYPVVIRHTGLPTNYAKKFEVRVVETESTMPSDKWSLPSQLEFQPMSKLDTFYLKLTNFAELGSVNKILCLELIENENFKLGDRDYRRIYLEINDNVAKPDWWSTRVTNYFLGVYSDKKFRKLMEIVQPDLSDTSESWIRNWALEFKIYLNTMQAAETPETEVDGSLMTVPVRM